MQTAEAIRAEGLLVTDAVVLLDRNQGAREHLHEHGIAMHRSVSEFYADTISK
jgi:orotate phosphoribosyltransferase